MIITFLSLTEPSQPVTALAIGGLLVLLIASQLMDYEGNSVKSLVMYLHAFIVPLLILFSLILIVSVVRVVFD